MAARHDASGLSSAPRPSGFHHGGDSRPPDGFLAARGRRLLPMKKLLVLVVVIALAAFAVKKLQDA